jgi:hypothetical protein
MQGGKKWILPKEMNGKPVLLGLSLAENLVKPQYIDKIVNCFSCYIVNVFLILLLRSNLQNFYN